MKQYRLEKKGEQQCEEIICAGGIKQWKMQGSGIYTHSAPNYNAKCWAE